MNSKLTIASVLLSAGVIVACSNPNEILVDDGSDNPACNDGTGCEGNGEDPGTPNPQAVCAPGREYLDFGGKSLTNGDSQISGAKRWEEVSGVDRDRLKPFSALDSEFTRVIGKAPGSLNSSKTTFGEPVARWYSEPQSSAIGIYTAFRVAFDGCLDYTNATDKNKPENAAFATIPDAATAGQVCATWTRKFWSRVATQAELDACVRMATQDSAKEMVESLDNPLGAVGTQYDTSAQRRWAYTCATVLTSSGFMSF